MKNRRVEGGGGVDATCIGMRSEILLLLGCEGRNGKTECIHRMCFYGARQHAPLTEYFVDVKRLNRLRKNLSWLMKIQVLYVNDLSWRDMWI